MKKVWLITGTARGLGLEIARAALHAGDNVVATARSKAALSDALGDDHDSLLTLPLDVCDEKTVNESVQQAIEHFGRIDVLVNNAAQAQLGWFETIVPAEVRRNFDINVIGAMAVTRAVLPVMRRQRAGLLVTISSINGLVANAGGSVYSATKFALEGWMEGLAQEVAPLGIGSLIIEPGMMKTDFLDRSSMRQGQLDIPDYAEAVAQFRAFIDSANHAQPGDPAQLAAKLIELASQENTPERFVFGADALEWAGAKLDRLQQEVDQSAQQAC